MSSADEPESRRLAPRGRLLKQRLRERAEVYGAYAFLPSADAAEVIATAGADFVVIDTQHSRKDWGVLGAMIRAVQCAGAAALVRVPSVSSADLIGVLDLGPDGLVVPGIRDASDVRALVNAVYYAPRGRRETCSMTRAVGYGAAATLADQVPLVNDGLVLVGIVEDAESIEQIDEIIAVEHGLDSVQLGRSDLAASLGHPGVLDHPEVLERVIGAFGVIERAGDVSYGALLYTPADRARWRGHGANVFIYQSDVGVLAREYRQAFTELRSNDDARRAAHDAPAETSDA